MDYFGGRRCESSVVTLQEKQAIVLASSGFVTYAEFQQKLLVGPILHFPVHTAGSES
jgi:hypothetical protein